MMNEDKINVGFLWNVKPELRHYLARGIKSHRVRLNFPIDTSEDELLRIASDAQILIGWRPTEIILECAPGLDLFINPGAGIQHLIELFRRINRKRQVILVNGHGNSLFTAQHAVALLLALTNGVILHHNWMRAGRWRTGDRDFPSVPLRNKSVGLLGYGAVNSKVHGLLSNFELDFRILKHGRTTSVNGKIFTPAELDTFLSGLDILILAVPLTDETRGMITLRELKLLNSTGLLVNISRGDVIDEGDLYKALKEGIIAGAAIDVWYDYRPEPDADGRSFPFHYPFQDLANVILSPHRAASPFNDLQRWNEVIQNIERYASGRKDLLNIVDLVRGY